MDENYEKRKATLLHTLIVVLIGAGVFLQFVGFVTPGWEVRQERDAVDDFTKVNHGGLWYVVLCDDQTKCEAVSAFNKTVGSRFSFSSYSSYSASEEYARSIQKEQIGCFFALASSVPAFLLVLLIKLNKISGACLKTTILLIVSMILCLGSGVLSMALCALMGNQQVNRYNYYMAKTREAVHYSPAKEDRVSPIGFPYSLFLFGLGGLSLAFTFVLLIILVVCNVYGHQMEMLNALKYTVPRTEATVSGNGSYPDAEPQTKPSLVISTENSASKGKSTMQPVIITRSNVSVPTNQAAMPQMPVKQVLTNPSKAPYSHGYAGGGTVNFTRPAQSGYTSGHVITLQANRM